MRSGPLLSENQPLFHMPCHPAFKKKKINMLVVEFACLKNVSIKEYGFEKFCQMHIPSSKRESILGWLVG